MDCRVPPELGEDYALARIEEVLGERRPTSSTSTSTWWATARRIDTPLMGHIRDFLERGGSGLRRRCPWCCRGSPTRAGSGRPSPTAWPTASSRRARWTCSRPRRSIHGADERMPVEDLGLAARFYAGPRAEGARMSEDGEAPARRHGAAQRPAGARADSLGRRGAHARRADRGGVRPQARASGRGRSSACPACAACRSWREAFAIVPIVKRALPAAGLPMEDAHGARRDAAWPPRSTQAIRRGGERTLGREAAVSAARPDARAARPARRRHRRLPRRRAQGDRRATRTDADAADATQGARPLRLEPGRAAAGHHHGRQRGAAPRGRARPGWRTPPSARRRRGGGGGAVRLVRAPLGHRACERAAQARLRDAARWWARREPTAEQLEVGRAALDGDPARGGRH